MPNDDEALEHSPGYDSASDYGYNYDYEQESIDRAKELSMYFKEGEEDIVSRFDALQEEVNTIRQRAETKMREAKIVEQRAKEARLAVEFREKYLNKEIPANLSENFMKFASYMSLFAIFAPDNTVSSEEEQNYKKLAEIINNVYNAGVQAGQNTTEEM